MSVSGADHDNIDEFHIETITCKVISEINVSCQRVLYEIITIHKAAKISTSIGEIKNLKAYPATVPCIARNLSTLPTGYPPGVDFKVEFATTEKSLDSNKLINLRVRLVFHISPAKVFDFLFQKWCADVKSTPRHRHTFHFIRSCGPDQKP